MIARRLPPDYGPEASVGFLRLLDSSSLGARARDEGVWGTALAGTVIAVGLDVVTEPAALAGRRLVRLGNGARREVAGAERTAVCPTPRPGPTQ